MDNITATFRTTHGATVVTTNAGITHQWRCRGCGQGQGLLRTKTDATTKANEHAGICLSEPRR